MMAHARWRKCTANILATKININSATASARVLFLPAAKARRDGADTKGRHERCIVGAVRGMFLGKNREAHLEFIGKRADDASSGVSSY